MDRQYLNSLRRLRSRIVKCQDEARKQYDDCFDKTDVDKLRDLISEKGSDHESVMALRNTIPSWKVDCFETRKRIRLWQTEMNRYGYMLDFIDEEMDRTQKTIYFDEKAQPTA